VGSGAAPADVPRNHISGRPRVAVRPYYGGPPSMAGRVRARGGESHPAREAKSLRAVAGRTAPGTEIAANSAHTAQACVRVERREARWADRKAHAALPSAELLQRLSALRSPRCGEQEEERRRGPRRNDRASGAMPPPSCPPPIKSGVNSGGHPVIAVGGYWIVRSPGGAKRRRLRRLCRTMTERKSWAV
jgi:hypothetical protein